MILFALGAAAWCGCGAKQEPGGGKTPAPTSAAKPSNAADAPAPTSAQGVLDAMVTAYKAATGYEDEGFVALRGRRAGQPVEDRFEYRVVLSRPAKIRVEVYHGRLVSNAENLFAVTRMLPNQVLRRPAPKRLSIGECFDDQILIESIAAGPTADYTWLPLQLVLLLADDPLKTLLYRSTAVTLLEPAEAEGRPCQRVEVARPEGKTIYWIDRETYVLRRVEFPVSLLTLGVPQQEAQLDAMVVELSRARLSAPTNPDAFAFEAPPEAHAVESLTPLGLADLGKPSPDFFFDGLDGKPVTLKSLAGKVVVIDFWATWCQPCRQWMPELEKVYARYKDNPNVVFLAVSVDEPKVDDAGVKKAIEEMGVHMPGYRDRQEFAFKAFRILGIPTTVLLDGKGRIQALHTDGNPAMAGSLAGWIERVLTGHDVFVDRQRAFQLYVDENRRIFDYMIKNSLFANPRDFIDEMPEMGVARKSAPLQIKLTSLWKCGELGAPSAVLPVPRPDGPPRLFVLDAGRAVVELDATTGKVLARNEFQVAEPVLFLRTAISGNGRRWFVGSCDGAQQFHVFDENWKLLASFPPNAEKNPHAGVGDVQVADLDGDGRLEFLVGYHGLVGVKCLDWGSPPPEKPNIKWSQRSVANVQKIAISDPDAQHHRNVLCTNDQTSLAVLDPAGQMAGKFSLGGRLLYWIVSADLNGDGQHQMCGLSAPEVGKNLALGIDAKGNLLWSYELPEGRQQSVDLVIPAHLAPGGPGQWLLAGPDGSLHLVSNEGRPVDQFNYGAPIRGMAVADFGDRHVLYIASPEGVEALATP